MNLSKPTHIAFLISGLISLVVAVFSEKFNLIYTQPFIFITIIVIYLRETKTPVNYLFLLSQVLCLTGGILLILGMREYLTEVSIIFTMFYIILLVLLYEKNDRKKSDMRTKINVFLISLPILFMYYLVISTVASELKDVIFCFSLLVITMLTYVIASVYYYLTDKRKSNLWMLMAAVNLALMNIIIAINELYVYDTIFTVVVVYCSLLFQFFVLKFMLNNDKQAADFIDV